MQEEELSALTLKHFKERRIAMLGLIYDQYDIVLKQGARSFGVNTKRTVHVVAPFDWLSYSPAAQSIRMHHRPTTEFDFRV